MLHSWKLVFPQMTEGFEVLSGMELTGNPPKEMKAIIENETK